MADKLSMPASSWSTLKQIIRAYGEVRDFDKPTVDKVAEIAGLQRTVISANNNFLREIGIVQESENKLSPLGAKLAAGLAMDNGTLVSEVLQEIVCNDSSLNSFVGMVRARGPMKLDRLKGEIALAGCIKQTGPTKPILDLLEESKLIQINDDMIKMGSLDSVMKSSEEVERAERLLRVQDDRRVSSNLPPWQDAGGPRIPLPLGPSRLAFIELPGDWQSKELSKLIKILQIALGEDSEGT